MNADRFAGRLKELREQAGLSQKALAEKTGLVTSAIGHLEQGLRKPTWETVLALCAALGVDCTAFQEQPEDAPAPQRGRPRKAPAVEPSKEDAAAADAPQAEATPATHKTDDPEPKKPTARKGKRKKGGQR